MQLLAEVPGPEWYWPAGAASQAWQSPPLPVVYLPAGQAVHVVKGDADVCPAGQLVHTRSCVAMLPAWQSVVCVLPTVQVVQAVHVQPFPAHNQREVGEVA